MKPRKWIIVFAILLFFVGTVSYVTKIKVERDPRLRAILVQKVSNVFGESFSVEQFSIGFLSIYLEDVKLSIPFQSIKVIIDDIKIGFSLFQLIKHRGDISKSINTIIFVHPRIDMIPIVDSKDSSNKEVSVESVFNVDALPVKKILVKNCEINITDDKGNCRRIGHKLTGLLATNSHNVTFDLKGCFATNTNNLFISGIFCPGSGKHHISMRLKSSAVKEPFEWNSVTIESGQLEGVCELTLTDTIFPYNINIDGWLSLDYGTGVFHDASDQVDNVTFMLRAQKNTIYLDSLKANWRNATIFGEGAFGIAQFQHSHFRIRIDDAGLPTVAKHIPEFLKDILGGSGWLEINANKDPWCNSFNAHLSAGGMKLHGESPIMISGNATIEKLHVSLDTLIANWPGLNFGASGAINFEKNPVVYSYSLNCEVNATHIDDDLAGKLAAIGTISGIGEDYVIDFTFEGHDLSLKPVLIGDPLIHVKGNNTTILISSDPKAYSTLQISGVIDSLSNLTQLYDINVAISHAGVNNIISTMPIFKDDILDSSGVFVHINGLSSRLFADVKLFLHNNVMDGIINIAGEIVPDSSKVYWSCKDDFFKLHGHRVALFAEGLFDKNLLHIDSLNIDDIISVNGELIVNDTGFVDLNIVSKNVLLTKVDKLFGKSAGIFTSGMLSLKGRFFGRADSVKYNHSFSLRDATLHGVSGLETDLVVKGDAANLTILPFVVRVDNKCIMTSDTLILGDTVKCCGKFSGFDIAPFVKKIIPKDSQIRGMITGTFSSSSGDGYPVNFFLNSPIISFDQWGLDSISTKFKIYRDHIDLISFRASDSSRSIITASASAPMIFLNGKAEVTDTIKGSLQIKGDLLASGGANFDSPVGGHGNGDLSIAFYYENEVLSFSDAKLLIPFGTMTVDPFIPDKIKDFSLVAKLNDDSKLSLNITGRVDKRRIIIHNTHTYPDSIEPIMLGPIDVGVLYVETPDNGIDIYVSNYMEMEKGNKADIEFLAKDPFPSFALSGPIECFRITGVWMLRSLEFTYPEIKGAIYEVEVDPFPYINWDLDIAIGNRKVVYFYNIGGKNRKMMRVFDCFLDPMSRMTMKGRDMDGTFKLLGSLRSYRGYAFYGRYFERDFDAGVNFFPEKMASGKNYNNMPIIWGSAEAASDSSRYDRIKLTLLVRDSVTGALSTKGRYSNISFRVSSNFEDAPGESEREFYRAAGLEFTTLRGAGSMVTNMGDSYINRYLLQRFERKLAKRLGLDVISLETSIASNYFNYLYDDPFVDQDANLAERLNYLTFANIGVTLGRYFFKDKLFLKWRTELVPNKFELSPEHSIGFEYQPVKYFWMDFNYGFSREQDRIQFDPELRMQLRLPISKIKDVFNKPY